jgi:hypothetical protein
VLQVVVDVDDLGHRPDLAGADDDVGAAVEPDLGVDFGP